MDEDYVGKQQDIYLWCFISKLNTSGVWKCPMHFTRGFYAGIHITEKGKYLTLEFCGKHHLHCHDEFLTMNGCNSARGDLGFRLYLK